MASPVVMRLLEIQQELEYLQGIGKPTPDALQRLQALANELQTLQGGPPPPLQPPPPVPEPPPPVFAGYNNFFPLYGAEPQGCGGCGACALCCDPCAPAACGNPLPLSVFQGPNGCAPAYTIQGPPGLIGPIGPTGPTGPAGPSTLSSFSFTASIGTTGASTDKGYTYTGTTVLLTVPRASLPAFSWILSVYFSATNNVGITSVSSAGCDSNARSYFVYALDSTNLTILAPATHSTTYGATALENYVYDVLTVGVGGTPLTSYFFKIIYV